MTKKVRCVLCHFFEYEDTATEICAHLEEFHGLKPLFKKEYP